LKEGSINKQSSDGDRRKSDKGAHAAGALFFRF